MMTRKELFKNTLRKAAHGWKRINELRLSGVSPSGRSCFVDFVIFVVIIIITVTIFIFFYIIFHLL